MEPKPLKMYVLVRDDLSTVYKCGQGLHAAIEYYEQGNETNWHNDTIVILSVPNERRLKEWAWMLQHKHKKKFVEFREPDLHDQLTSIACIDTGEVFKKLPLAK